MTKNIILKRVLQFMMYIQLFVLVLFSVAFTQAEASNNEKKVREPFFNNIDYATLPKSYTILNQIIRLTINADTIPFHYTKEDTNGINRNVVNGKYWLDENGLAFSIADTLMLNYKKWIVAPGNQLLYTLKGISVNHLLLHNDTARISITSRDEQLNSPIDITIQNFDARDLTAVWNIDTLKLSGLLNAQLTVSEFGKLLPAVTGNASVSNFQWMQLPPGNLELNMQKVAENTIYTTIALTGNGTEVNLKGNYFLNKVQEQIAALVEIKQLPFGIIKGFTKSSNTAPGNINGSIALNGKLKQPIWKGSINIDSAHLTLNQSGTTYSIDKQMILLDYPFVLFKSFTVRDSLDNPFVMDGSLCYNALKKYDVDLHLLCHNFSLFNAPKAINNLGYGNAGVNANVVVTGTSETPVIKGDIYLNDNTAITMVLPEKNVDSDASRSVVNFIDMDVFSLPTKGMVNKETTVPINYKQYVMQGLNLHAKDKSSLTLVIDPTNGDELKMQGNADLQLGIMPSGNHVFEGNYILDSGYYELNYQFLKKRFNIVKGSTINFGGGPMDALINIKATYVANTSARDLLSNEVGSVAPAIANSFNRKIPFIVILFLKGSLKNPDISFDIKIGEGVNMSPQLRTTIENKLVQLRSDIAATNKQVFALLVLDRFVGEQSTDFFKGNGNDFSGIARESVSRFLSAALDQFASDLFKGINVDLNLNSYQDFVTNSGTQKNDLNVEVSKNFLNDRLNVTVGKNFGIESQDGSAKAAQQKGSRFLPDVTVNYKLSADGKYMLRAYNKDPFEVILDGYIVETGLAFIISMDYEKFKELFLKHNKSTTQ